MPIPDRIRCRAAEPGWDVLVTDDGSRTLVCRKSGDAYHSGCGALEESRHVYLNNSGVASRLTAGQACRVLEIGLGTGMSALLTFDVARQHRAPLVYVALENRLPASKTLRQLRCNRWADDDLVAGYLEWLDGVHATDAGVVSPVWRPQPGLELRLFRENALTWQPRDLEPFDAVYFDPFAPASAPEFWTESFLGRVAGLLKPDGRLVTYCVSRSVRDVCSAVGLRVVRVAGPPGGKREVMIAHRDPATPPR